MTRSPGAVTKAELHAFVDGQLDEARRRDVAAYLAEHPEEAARVAAYEEQKAMLHALFDPVLDARPSPELKPPAVTRRLVRAAWAAAAALVLLIAGASLGWYFGTMTGADATQGAAVARQAAVAHAVFTPERRHPVEVAADQEAHLVAWLSKRLGAPLRAPRLTDLGFSLVGGRLLTAADGPAAQFMYENVAGKRLTLYVVTGLRRRETTAFRYRDEKGVAVFYWIDGPLGYALTAEIERPELLGVARAVYRQLNPPGSRLRRGPR